jgi:hypothetical protein
MDSSGIIDHQFIYQNVRFTFLIFKMDVCCSFFLKLDTFSARSAASYIEKLLNGRLDNFGSQRLATG